MKYQYSHIILLSYLGLGSLFHVKVAIAYIENGIKYEHSNKRFITNSINRFIQTL